MASLPIYTIGFYLLPRGSHKKMDTIKSCSSGDEFKYHMVKWTTMCRPKQYGELGIINTHILNECLMVKWIWKLYTKKESPWARLVNAKYMRNGDLFRSRGG
jgi:hypothetical protein